MDLSQIPKCFWHSLSFTMIALTGGLLLYGYRASSVSIEIANTKISLSHAVSEAENINRELQSKAEALQRAKAELEARVAQYEQEVERLNARQTGTAPSGSKPPAIKPLKFNLNDVAIPETKFDAQQKQLDSLKSRLLDTRQFQQGAH